MKFSELKKKQVIDSDGDDIGRVIDFVFKYSENELKLKSVILGGSRIEELLEAMKIKEDRDPVFQLDCIDRIEQDVYLKVDGETLKTTLDQGTLEEDDFKLSKLKDLPVVDSDGFKVGKVIDVWFDAADDIWLVLGGGFIEETLEKAKVKPDVDLIMPMHYIKNISKKEICLKWTKFQLQSNCEQEYEKYKRQVSSAEGRTDARYEVLRLTGHGQKGLT